MTGKMASEGAYQRIDQSNLPPAEACANPSELKAEFYADGQLQCFYRIPKADHWALTLEHGKEAGIARLEAGYGGTPDSESYADGRWQRFDAFSDNETPRSMEWIEWVQKWIRRIAEN